MGLKTKQSLGSNFLNLVRDMSLETFIVTFGWHESYNSIFYLNITMSYQVLPSKFRDELQNYMYNVYQQMKSKYENLLR